MRTSCKMSGFFVKCLLPLSLFVLAAGCGRSGTVSGKVYYKGEVLKSGTVGFFPEGQGGSFSSPIGPDGSYSIAKLPAGPAKITVLSAASGPPSGLKGGGGKGGKKGPQTGGQNVAKKGMEQQSSMLKKKENIPPGAPVGDASSGGVDLPPKYSDPQKSGLQVEVTGGKQNFDIKMD